MSQSSFGKKFVSSHHLEEESRGKELSVPFSAAVPQVFLSAKKCQVFLDRRKPGQSRYTTARKEGDLVEILSGVFEGKTTGTPISLLIRNTDQRSRDYGNIAFSYHSQSQTLPLLKYGFVITVEGGRSSGRNRRTCGGRCRAIKAVKRTWHYIYYLRKIGRRDPILLRRRDPK